MSPNPVAASPFAAYLASLNAAAPEPVRVGKDVHGKTVELPIGGKLELELNEHMPYAWEAEPGDRTLGSPTKETVTISDRIGGGTTVRFIWSSPPRGVAQPGSTHSVKVKCKFGSTVGGVIAFQVRLTDGTSVATPADVDSLSPNSGVAQPPGGGTARVISPSDLHHVADANEAMRAVADELVARFPRVLEKYGDGYVIGRLPGDISGAGFEMPAHFRIEDGEIFCSNIDLGRMDADSFNEIVVRVANARADDLARNLAHVFPNVFGAGGGGTPLNPRTDGYFVREAVRGAPPHFVIEDGAFVCANYERAPMTPVEFSQYVQQVADASA